MNTFNTSGPMRAGRREFLRRASFIAASAGSPFALNLLAMGAASAYVASALGASRLGSSWARLTLWLAWVLHGLVLLWGLWGETPRFGFAPALSFTAWLAAGIYAVESHLFPMLKARWSLSGLGALAMWLALAFPGNALHATASAWLPAHWALGIASYGLFAAAVVHVFVLNLIMNSTSTFVMRILLCDFVMPLPTVRESRSCEDDF